MDLPNRSFVRGSSCSATLHLQPRLSPDLRHIKLSLKHKSDTGTEPYGCYALFKLPYLCACGGYGSLDWLFRMSCLLRSDCATHCLIFFAWQSGVLIFHIAYQDKTSQDFSRVKLWIWNCPFLLQGKVIQVSTSIYLLNLTVNTVVYLCNASLDC